MQSTIQIITPATNSSLVSVPEAKLALNLSRSTDMTLNDQIEMFIDWSSNEIVWMAGRDFAEETVVETLRDVDGQFPYRIFLSRYPVSNIQSVTADGVELTPACYELDAEDGKITRIDGSHFNNTVVVKYTGGYKVPADTPSSLKKAALLLTREAYYSAIRGDATVRMIGHKEARVIYFDPLAALKIGGSGAGGSPATRAAGELVKAFTRYYA